jgi:hypothetical protein
MLVIGITYFEFDKMHGGNLTPFISISIISPHVSRDYYNIQMVCHLSFVRYNNIYGNTAEAF